MIRKKTSFLFGLVLSLFLITLVFSGISNVQAKKRRVSAKSKIHRKNKKNKNIEPEIKLKASVNWILTDNEKRSYLNYYSPIILKRADEDDSDNYGWDWITNYYFDNDKKFRNNKENWEDGLEKFINNEGNNSWKIRPTLYTSIIEFMDGDKKCLVLLYHVYHAMQYKHIHDWERVEIRIDDVTNNPAKSKINYVVITEHSRHKSRKLLDKDLRFHFTLQGNHVLLFQAEWSRSRKSPVRKAELHYVSNYDIFRKPTAEVFVDRIKDPLSYHYIFVNKADKEAVKYWNAQSLNQENAKKLSAKISYDTIPLKDVKRIEYELQDIADIFPTSIKKTDEKIVESQNPDWHGNVVKILFDDPKFKDYGYFKDYKENLFFQWYWPKTVDITNKKEKKEAYPAKHWFWGAYLFGHKGNFYKRAFENGSPVENSRSRNIISGFKDSINNFWWQHDFFAHDGIKGDGSIEGEKGKWLPLGWHKPELGGFDGRWVSLFDD